MSFKGPCVKGLVSMPLGEGPRRAQRGRLQQRMTGSLTWVMERNLGICQTLRHGDSRGRAEDVGYLDVGRTPGSEVSLNIDGPQGCARDGGSGVTARPSVPGAYTLPSHLGAFCCQGQENKHVDWTAPELRSNSSRVILWRFRTLFSAPPNLSLCQGGAIQRWENL